MNVSVSALAVHYGSFERAPRWRAAISLALSIALHAVLLALFLRPAPPAAPTGGFDVVTVYLRDSRRSSPPSAPESQLVPTPGRRTVAAQGSDEAPKPLGRKPSRSLDAASDVRERRTPRKPTRTSRENPVTLARSADASPAKPSLDDRQGNPARDSSALYLRELAARLSQVKRYPQLAVLLHEEGTVLLSFQIDRNGRLLAWNIASSSGHDDLDSEVGRMVAAAAPFPPFPPSLDKPAEVFRVPIGFYLH